MYDVLTDYHLFVRNIYPLLSNWLEIREKQEIIIIMYYLE